MKLSQELKLVQFTVESLIHKTEATRDRVTVSSVEYQTAASLLAIAYTHLMEARNVVLRAER